jgi:hypothetical protein
MKYKVGDRVVPLKKSIGCRTDENWKHAKEKKQPFLYVNNVFTTKNNRYNAPYYECDNVHTHYGNHYAESDLIPFDSSENSLFELLVQGIINSNEYTTLLKGATSP